jgi:hypothetical protein
MISTENFLTPTFRNRIEYKASGLDEISIISAVIFKVITCQNVQSFGSSVSCLCCAGGVVPDISIFPRLDKWETERSASETTNDAVDANSKRFKQS